MLTMRLQHFAVPLLVQLTAFCLLVTCGDQIPDGHWPQWGRDFGGSRFSPLTDINKSNVQRLQVAWVYNYSIPSKDERYSHEATPILVDDGSGRGRELLIFCTPWNELIALNPVTGRQVYRQDQVVEHDHSKRGAGTCRGVSSWLDTQKNDGAICRRVIYMTTVNSLLVALDAATGQLCPDFGDQGIVNASLPGGIYHGPDGTSKMFTGFTSPPSVVRDTVVVGIGISDGETSGPPSGQPRGYDCRTGALKWRFHVIPQNESDPAYRTWQNGTAEVGGGNVWAPISADEESGLVYLPTSCAHFDYWGGNRKGKNEYTSSVVALDAETGAYRWHYQLVHHDVWNYDAASQPVIALANGTRKAVLQITKTGMLFVLDARTGEPIFPVEDRRTPVSKMPDDEMWPTQPHVIGELGQLTAQSFTLDDIFNEYDEEHVEECRSLINDTFKIRELRSQMFTPFEVDRATMHIPGDLGGGNWMSLALHPERHIAVIPVNNLPTVRQLFRRDEKIADWCLMGGRPLRGAPYYGCQVPFMNPETLAVPCHKPPWARLHAVDLTEGRILWTRPYAEPLSIGDLPRTTGVRRVLGGVIVTASGLVIATGGTDLRMWAYDLDTGRDLWTSDFLDHDTTSVPMTYKVAGKQFITVSAGGHWADGGVFPKGGLIYAYALPDDVTPSPTGVTPPRTLPPTPAAQASTRPEAALFVIAIVYVFIRLVL